MSDNTPSADSAAFPVLDARGATPGTSAAPPDPHADEHHNLTLLSVHQVIFRTGWVFKTESVVMPAFLDAVSSATAAGTLRSLLPLLNRLGQSIPPLLYAPRLQAMRRKKWSLAFTTLLMAVPLLALALLALGGYDRRYGWMAPLYLLLYAVFSCCMGLNNLALGTLQGKLIRPARRGRLLMLGAFFGSGSAIVFAWLLMATWLEQGYRGFGLVFGFCGLCFVLASLSMAAVREPPDVAGTVVRGGLRRHVQDAWRLWREDGRFRRLCTVAMLYSISSILFPHYQALARERLDLGGSDLMYWVVVQNAAIAVFSLLAGPLADARGNRLALRMVILLSAVGPVLALMLTYVPAEAGRQWFWVVFSFIGMTPLSLRLFSNYALEIGPVEQHARYLSTLSLATALPFCLSPVVGVLVDVLGFDAVFCGGAVLLVGCELLTWGLPEPRHETASAQASRWRPARPSE
jgi:MFS family permease